MTGKTLMERFRALPPQSRKAIMAELSPDERAALAYHWPLWARPQQLPPEGDWLVWLIMAGRGYGKGCCVNTPVPTPDGWKALADIKDGDRLYDENGDICRVVKAHEPYWAEAYEVIFSDGATIIADGPHMWRTWDKAARKAYGRAKRPTIHPQVRDTMEIMRTLRTGKNGRETNHSIEAAKPLAAGHSEQLPIPPYTFGVWLGDGGSWGEGVHLADRDAEAIIAGIEAEGCVARQSTKGRGCHLYHITVRGRPLVTVLKEANLFRNKHIPLLYLRASPDARMALLRGMIDTDGHVSRHSGTVELCFTNERLAHDAFEIIVSLGYIARIAPSEASYDGNITGTRWRIHFMAGPEVATVPFKASRLRMPGRQANRRTHRYIKDVRPAGKKLVRCLTVDSNSRLFLIGRHMIPTHNTRTGAEWVRMLVNSGKYGRIALVGEDSHDVREVMVEGNSGLMSVFPPWQRPSFSMVKQRVEFHNGAIGYIYSSVDYERLRGPQHHAAWVDELAKFRYAQDVWDQLMLGMRLGDHPRVCVTTTPKPIPLLFDLVKDKTTVVTRGSTFDNLENLSPQFRRVIEKYRGSFLEMQEVHGQLIDERPHAMFKRAYIEEARIGPGQLPEMKRVVVGVDPPASSEGAECGIIVAGLGEDDQYYILDDLSMRGSPFDWGKRVLEAYQRHEADMIVAEVNQGGDMVVSTLQTVAASTLGDPSALPVRKVRATRGKAIRAQPVAVLYEQRKVHHVGGFSDLETQMIMFEPQTGVSGNVSPDRVDALVWAVTDLIEMGNTHEIGIGVV